MNAVPEEDANENQLDQTLILEQYKLYVEMADRVSSRRHGMHLAFITLHTIVLAAAGQMMQVADGKYSAVSIPLVAVGIGFSLLWILLTRSYRRLSEAKYAVVGQLEKKLPAQPYSIMEWKLLNGSEKQSKYTTLTQIETYIPILFLIVYACAVIVFLRS